jgi:DeoR/GlpR family transcriptional regulator of sugar metabolism
LIRAERIQQIVDIVQKGGKVTIDDLCLRFGVSEMTARRDLEELDREGLVRRVHGGAISSFGRSFEPPYPSRSHQNLEIKRLIGKRAAELVNDGESIALDIGTTTLEIARALRERRNLTLITASLPIANELISNSPVGSQMRLILTGGIIRPAEHSMVGHIAERTYQEIHVDKAFIAVGGINLKDGLTEFNLEDSLVKRSLIGNARQVVVVADSSKFGRTTFATICPLSSVNTIVTDNKAPKQILDALSKQGIQVCIVNK